MIDTLGRFIRGEIGLAATFWQGTLWFAAIFAVNVVVALSSAVWASIWTALVFLGWALMVQIVMIVWTVAIWRSAKRYEGPLHWAGLARAALMVAWLACIWIYFVDVG